MSGNVCQSIGCMSPAVAWAYQGGWRCERHAIKANDGRAEARAEAMFTASEERRSFLHSAEREVLEACVEEVNAEDAFALGHGGPCDANDASSTRQAAVRRYRALLDAKGPESQGDMDGTK